MIGGYCRVPRQVSTFFWALWKPGMGSNSKGRNPTTNQVDCWKTTHFARTVTGNIFSFRFWYPPLSWLGHVDPFQFFNQRETSMAFLEIPAAQRMAYKIVTFYIFLHVFWDNRFEALSWNLFYCRNLCWNYYQCDICNNKNGDWTGKELETWYILTLTFTKQPPLFGAVWLIFLVCFGSPAMVTMVTMVTMVRRCWSSSVGSGSCWWAPISSWAVKPWSPNWRPTSLRWVGRWRWFAPNRDMARNGGFQGVNGKMGCFFPRRIVHVDHVVI